MLITFFVNWNNIGFFPFQGKFTRTQTSVKPYIKEFYKLNHHISLTYECNIYHGHELYLGLGYWLFEGCHLLLIDMKIMCYLYVKVIQKVRRFRLKSENFGQWKNNWKFHFFFLKVKECREFSFHLTVFSRVTSSTYCWYLDHPVFEQFC